MAEAAVAQTNKYTRKLSGLDKAAILMLSLPDTYVAKIFQKLEDIEVKELSHKMAHLGTIKSEVVEQLYYEFAEKVSTTGSVYGSLETTEKILSKIFDTSKVKKLMEEIRGPSGRTVWDKLSNIGEDVLATFLKNEYPQTVAVVLSKIKPDQAARVIPLLPEELSIEVLQRMLRIDNVQRDILEEIETTLRSEFMANLSKTAAVDPYEQMAEIFNAFDRASEAKYMTALEEKDNEAADRVKSLMFTFDDLVKLDANSMQAVIRVVDKSKMALALKGASDVIKDLFFKNMSERAAKLLKEDMEALGMVRIRDVDEAQMNIVLQVKDLAARGEVVIRDDDDDSEMVG